MTLRVFAATQQPHAAAPGAPAAWGRSARTRVRCPLPAARPQAPLPARPHPPPCPQAAAAADEQRHGALARVVVGLKAAVERLQAAQGAAAASERRKTNEQLTLQARQRRRGACFLLPAILATARLKQPVPQRTAAGLTLAAAACPPPPTAQVQLLNSAFASLADAVLEEIGAQSR